MATAGPRHTWVSSAVWNKPWFRNWKRGTKLLWFYLTTCGDNSSAGVYVLDPDVAKMKTGPGWTPGVWERARSEMYPHVVFYPGGWVWIPGYLEHNTHGVNEKIAKGIIRVVNEAPEQLRADFMGKYSALLGVYGVAIDTPSIPPRYPFDDTSPPHPTPDQVQQAILRDTRAGSKGRLTKEQGLWVVNACEAFRKAAVKHTGFGEPEGYQEGVLKSLFKRRILKGDDADDLLGAVQVFAERKAEYDERTGRTSGFSAKEFAQGSTYDSLQREYQARKKRANG